MAMYLVELSGEGEFHYTTYLFLLKQTRVTSNATMDKLPLSPVHKSHVDSLIP